MASALGINQYRNPAVQKALQGEMDVIKDILAKAHPKGMVIKDIAKKFHSKQGYMLQPHTVNARLKALQELDEVHESVQKGKYGAKLFILGPDPKPIGVEAQPDLPFTGGEPPLASDEMLSLLYHMEGHLTAQMQMLDKKLTAIITELGIDCQITPINPSQEKENNNA